jgi:ketosteroid isomerase-like protein
MGARGPHDDFESAEKLIRQVYAEFSEHQDFSRTCDEYVSDDVEYVTRHGTFHGSERWKSEFESQASRWEVLNEVQDVIDAGEGAVIVLTEFRRVDRDTGEVAWKTWPAAVLRVEDGKCVFFEGYIDSRKALEEFGVEQG